MTDEEKFFAWLDGELAPAEADAMSATVAADPALRKLASEHRALAGQLRNAFDPIAAAAVPPPLGAALRPQAEVIDFASRKRRTFPAFPQWAAMAATLAIGIFVGTLAPGKDGSPVAVDGGKLYAASTLGAALDKQLANAPTGSVRIGLTFRGRKGEICRTFVEQASSGLACREGDRWQVRGMFAAPEGQGGDYRMAAGMDPNLAALIDSTAAGEPFDAAAERAARENGWRS